MSSRFLVDLIATGTSALKVVGVLVAEEGRRTHISHSVEDPYVRGNNVIHCVADPKVMEI